MCIRDRSDALKRRCLYHWVNYPSFEKEKQIVQKHLPDINEKILTKLVQFVHQLREMKLDKSPGIAETLDWANGLLKLHATELDVASVEKSLGCVLKSNGDIEKVKSEGVGKILENL